MFGVYIKEQINCSLYTFVMYNIILILFIWFLLNYFLNILTIF
nr:MAG TPA: hypothetical protein [Caudoviricetes sp.]DAL33949.1 MAG TPA_asm: hypothetical protein [Caudoviricetes sp.]